VPSALELYGQGRHHEIWQKCCGFIDLEPDEFMRIQNRLLLEQLQLLGASKFGRDLMGERTWGSADDFRKSVPLTTYADYAEYFKNRDESILPVQPLWWLHTSGRSGEFRFKWVPYTARMVKRLGETTLGMLTFSSCSGRGDFPFEEGDRILYAWAPLPYVSGGLARAVRDEFPFRFLPPLEEAEQMQFQERIEKGFQMALREGIDSISAASTILVRIGERFSQRSSSTSVSPAMLHPRIILRMVRGLLRARLDGRSYLLPSDLWSIKGIAAGGTDAQVYRDKIRELWGREPIEAYALTEGGILALQLWNGKGMTLVPHVNFLEFIPMAECERSQADPAYQPQTLLLNEIEVGGVYEVVITNFLGGVYTRYRTHDLIQVVSLKDDEIGVNLPQIVFYSKSGDVMDLGSLCRLTEPTIWKAIEKSGIDYNDWVAVKEFEDKGPVLKVYIEPVAEAGSFDQTEAQRLIHLALCELDEPYADVESLLGTSPLRIAPLPPGAFRHYYDVQQQRGADLAHLKPPRMRPTDAQLSLLMSEPAEASRRPA
jgi:hypothetical protein